ncbi:hypothetical protein [Micromonospora parva]|uniref:hypothetical protein n=1 Tax=Micromonospora parva TaxID=1464048 RepID=UPI0036589A11
MRGKKCALVAGTLVAWLLAVPGTAQAAPVDEPAAPALTVEQTPVTVRTVVSAPESITVDEFLKRRAASARALPIADPLAMAASSCSSYSVTRLAENAFGGDLYKLTLRVDWCYNGSSVWGASGGWSYSTGYGWSFDKWTNSPNTYYVGNTEAHTVGQAKFCISWCAGTGHLGHDVYGNRSGGTGYRNI